VFFKGSRYASLVGQATTTTLPTGEQQAYLPIRLIPPTPATVRHTVSAHERLDLLAYRFYGDAERFWLIADANGAMDPEDLLEPGRSILIPPSPGS
jgi:nucleoid-associated protein YgaU